MKDVKEMSQQMISKQDIINVLNDMINEKNKTSIRQLIDKLVTLDDEEVRQELDRNNISTIEDVRKHFQDRLPKKCKLSDLDVENTYFHFTDENSLMSINQNGLISNIGKHSDGIDEKASIFFSSGMISTLQGTNTWIKWLMHRMYGEKNQFGIYNGLEEEEKNLKYHEWGKAFLSKEYLVDNKRKEKVFELSYHSLKEKIFLTVDLKPEVDFSSDDIDYNKKNALDQKEMGNIKPYLYMKEMYGEYSDVDSIIMDKWNMHTYFDAKIEPERIMQVTDSSGRTDMLHILMEMYDRCKVYGDIKLDILDDFMFYAKQKEQLFTKKLGLESWEEQQDTAFLDKIESKQKVQERMMIERQNAQKNVQNR